MANEEDDILGDLGKLDLPSSPGDAASQAPQKGAANPSVAAKVALDLEGAPFMADDPPPPAEEKAPPKESSPPPKSPKTQKPTDDDADAKRQKRKKLIIIAGASVAGLLLIIVILILLMGKSSAPPPQPQPTPPAEPAHTAPPPHDQGRDQGHSGNATAKEAAPPEPEVSLLAFEPFMVEKKDRDGKIVFLYAKFTASSTNQRLLSEINAKKVVLRDAMFFYLSNKDLQYLSDSTKVESLKRDLLNVINEHLTSGELKDILIENYLVQ